MKPILFSTPMVKALLAETKTQTRRVIKTREEYSYRPVFEPLGLRYVGGIIRPRYSLNDTIYVRESMAIDQEGEWHYIADEPDYKGWGYKGVPSIHVPKSMSRIFLKVTDVRAERLQDIDNENAKAEGMEDIPNCARGYLANFMLLWDDLNAKRGFPWKDNPWVWVYEFEKTEAQNEH